MFSLDALTERLGGEVRGDGATQIAQVAPIELAGAGQLSFVAQAKYRKALDATAASAVIVPPSLAEATALPRIVVADPYLYYARAAQLFNPPHRPPAGVHPSAVVECPVPAGASIGPLAYVGPDCILGEGVVIGAGCTLAAGVTLGKDTWLHARVSIYAGCSLGERCIVHSGAVIGADGFGYARDRNRWVKIPQIGSVRIGDDVEIGANTTIDRGAMIDTIIENGVKLDNLIQIAHNCRVGEDTAMAAFAGMAGSSKIGKRVMVGGQAGIMGHVEVADDVVVSARSFISKSVAKSGIYTSAIPSQVHAEWVKNAVHLRHLDAMADRIRALEHRLAEMEKKA